LADDRGNDQAHSGDYRQGCELVKEHGFSFAGEFFLGLSSARSKLGFAKHCIRLGVEALKIKIFASAVKFWF
jgi:hypothetical protein